MTSWGFWKLVFNLNAGSSGREGGEGLSYLVLPPTSNSSWRRNDDTNDIEFVICFEKYPYWYRSFTKMVSCADSDSHSFWWPIVIVIQFSHFSIITTNRLDIRQMHTFALNGSSFIAYFQALTHSPRCQPYMISFYRTQVYLGSDLWVQVSVRLSVSDVLLT